MNKCQDCDCTIRFIFPLGIRSKGMEIGLFQCPTCKTIVVNNVNLREEG